MRQRWIVGLGLVTLLAIFPAVAQAETIFGFFEGLPNGQNSGTGAMQVKGWALATSGVRVVTVQVDGVDFGQARFGLSRPDVAALHPTFVDSDGAGYSYQLDSTQFDNGLHTVSIKARTFDGNESIVGSRVFNFVNNSSILVPFGMINTPQRNSDLFGTCNQECGSAGAIYQPVTGWALDLGTEIHDAGVAWVELMLDGSILYSSRTDCTYLPGLGIQSCYGLPRLDVERNFPFALDAPTSGFRFMLEVGCLINSGWIQGQHTLGVRVGDLSTQTAEVDEYPVTFWCVENNPQAGIIGYIESPREGRVFAGNMRFQGWTVALGTVNRVEVFVDGDFVGDAQLNVASRPGVVQNYPGYPGNDAPVWRLDGYDTNDLANGEHQAQFRVTDTEGVQSIIGEVTFFVNNG